MLVSIVVHKVEARRRVTNIIL